jgi:hypothetical protein
MPGPTEGAKTVATAPEDRSKLIDLRQIQSALLPRFEVMIQLEPCRPAPFEGLSGTVRATNSPIA